MSKETIIIEHLPLNEADCTHKETKQKLQVEVGYEAGGTNFLTGDHNGRGIYLRMRPITERDGFVSMLLFHGGKAKLETTARFNAKRLAQWAASVKQHPAYQELLGKVLADANLSLAA